jgi:hypothetical protein
VVLFLGFGLDNMDAVNNDIVAVEEANHLSSLKVKSFRERFILKNG